MPNNTVSVAGIRKVEASSLIGNLSGSVQAAEAYSTNEVKDWLALATADVAGLDAALANVYTKTESDARYAAAVHGHVISDITGLATTLSGLASDIATIATTYVPNSRTVSAGTGLSGGGALSSNISLSLAATTVAAGSYTLASITVDAYGRLTAASSGSVDLSGYLTTAAAASTYVALSGSYANPTWLTSLAWSKISSTPTTLSGYGITDAQPLDSDLTAIAALSTVSFGRGFLTLADQAAARTYIGAGTSSFDGAYSSLSGIPSTFTPAAHNQAWSTITSTPTTLSGYGITNAYTKTEVDNLVAGLLDFKGSLDCSANPNYPAGSKGDAYYVSVAGKIGGASGKSVDVGDMIVASADNAGGTEASVGTSWFVLEHNLTGALVASNNLSDLANAATARGNLGLGTLATQNGTFSGTSSGTNTGDQTITLTGDITGSGTGTFATTLATVNVNVGSFGSATQIPSLTVNAKGLITAVSNVTVTPALGSITGFGTGVAAALAIATGSAGAPVLFNGALGTPASGNLVNCTFPTLNQNTTGNAATVSTIAGMISAGTNVTITGSGTSGSPYVINASGGGTPGGSNTQIQYNNSGAFAGSSSLTFNSTLGQVAVPSISLTGNISSPAWTTNGIGIAHTTRTLTDTTSTGTVAAAYTNVLGGNTIAASNVTTFTDYASLWLGTPTAGTNVTITYPISLITAGRVRFGGQISSTSGQAIGLRAGSFGADHVTIATTGTVTFAQTIYTPAFYSMVMGNDVFFARDVASTLELRNSTSAITFALSNTYTSGTNFEQGKFQWVTNEWRIGTAVGSAGGTQRAVAIGLWNSAGTFTAAFSASTVATQVNSTGDIQLRPDNANNVVYIGANSGGVLFQNACKTLKVNSGGFTFSQPAMTTTAFAPIITTSLGAHTNLTASTEATDINFDLNRTVQFAAGALTTQRAFRIQAPTYAFVTASTITTASTLAISGAPIAGTNATITNSVALNVDAGFAAAIPVRINGAASQSGNLLEVRDSGGSIGFMVTSGWVVTANRSGGSPNGSFAASETSSGYAFQGGWGGMRANTGTMALGNLLQSPYGWTVVCGSGYAFDIVNATNAQTLRVFNTFTSTTSHEYLKFSWATNVAEIGTVKGSGGGSARDLVIKTDDVTRMTFAAAGTATVNTAFVTSTTALMNSGSQAFNSSFHLVSWNGGFLGWASGGTVTASSTLDTALKRVSAGLVEINTGTAGVYGSLVLKDLRMSTPTVPATSSSTGSEGQISWDANYVYVCTATNTWKRAALATF